MPRGKFSKKKTIKKHMSLRFRGTVTDGFPMLGIQNPTTDINGIKIIFAKFSAIEF